MKNKLCMKKNNKGLSLVEILVAMAVAGIVMTVIIAFISSGSRYYKKQSNSINLQNELQEISNKISDSLMEADAVYINGTKNADGSLNATQIITGKYTTDAYGNPNSFVSTKGIGRNIVLDGSSLYVYDAFLDSSVEDDFKNGYIFSNYVTSVKIAVNENCVNVQGDTVYYTQPLMFDVTITVSNKGETRTDAKTTKLRTKNIDTFCINNTKQNLIN